jgi:hypothetical protein
MKPRTATPFQCETTFKDEDSICELARLNFPDIACYAIPTLAARQIVSKATEGVFLHNVFAWFTRLSCFIGPYWFILLRGTTVAAHPYQDGTKQGFG